MGADTDRPPTNARVTAGIVRGAPCPPVRSQAISRTSSTSARLPTAMEPTSSAMPAALAGFTLTSENARARSMSHVRCSTNTASSKAAG